MSLALLVKNDIFAYLTLKLTLKMNNQSSRRNSLYNQNDTKKKSTSHEKDVLHFFLFFFLKINGFFYILTLEFTLRP